MFPKIIDALITSDRSRGQNTFTVACVPTGIKTGVETSPPGKFIVVNRALFKDRFWVGWIDCIIGKIDWIEDLIAEEIITYKLLFTR